MTRSSHQQVTQHFVSLNKFDASIERVMKTMWSLLHSRRSQLLMPTLVGIDVDYNGYPNAVCVLRTFFEKLRSVHQKQFVRFVTDTLWAKESGNGDIFYVQDKPKDDWCDVVWTVKIASPTQFEVTITLSHDARRYELIDDLTVNLKKFIPATKTQANSVSIGDLVLDFYTKTKRVHQINRMDENFHIMIVPTGDGKGYYPIPLYGISYDDAKRRARYAVRQLEFHRQANDELFTKDPSIGHLFYTVLSLIQDNAKFGLRQKTAHETYGLVELLFGLYADYADAAESLHDIVLVHAVEPKDERVDTYHYNMDVLLEEARKYHRS